jgi:hypothetical protein
VTELRKKVDAQEVELTGLREQVATLKNEKSMVERQNKTVVANLNLQTWRLSEKKIWNNMAAVISVPQASEQMQAKRWEQNGLLDVEEQDALLPPYGFTRAGRG